MEEIANFPVSKAVIEAALDRERVLLPFGLEIGRPCITGKGKWNWNAMVIARGYASREPGLAAVRRVLTRYPEADPANWA